MPGGRCAAGPRPPRRVRIGCRRPGPAVGRASRPRCRNSVNIPRTLRADRGRHSKLALGNRLKAQSLDAQSRFELEAGFVELRAEIEQVVKELQGSGAGSFDVTPRSAYYQLSLDLMKERAAQSESLVLLRQKEADLQRAEQLFNEKPPIIPKTQYELAKSAVDALKTTISARSNLIERLEIDLKNFALQEPGGGPRSGRD